MSSKVFPFRQISKTRSDREGLKKIGIVYNRYINLASVCNPTYHDTVVRTAERFAVTNAVAHVPPGPLHDQVVTAVAAQAMQQVQHMLNQVFEALRLSLAVAIQHGFLTVLVFCVAAIAISFFLKDLPLAQRFQEGPDEASEARMSEEMPTLP